MTNEERAKAWIKTWLDHPCLMPSNAHAREQDLISILNQVQAEAEQPRVATIASQAPSQGGIPPYTPAASGGALSALVAQWRNWAKEVSQGTDIYNSAAAAKRVCADELEAAIAAHDQRPQVSGASPVCLDCNKTGIRNCSHFDNCDGTWVYKSDASHDQKVRDAEREKVAAWMAENSFATGHGDSVEDLLKELKWQIEERVGKVREQVPSEKWLDEAARRVEQWLCVDLDLNTDPHDWDLEEWAQVRAIAKRAITSMWQPSTIAASRAEEKETKP